MSHTKRTLSAVLESGFGYNAAICTALSLHNNAAFELKQAVFSSLRKETKNVPFDAAKLAALGIGTKGGPDDNGTEKPIVVDPVVATEYLAASFILLARFAMSPNPENKGKVESGLLAYLRDPNAVAADAVAWASDKSDDAMNIRSNGKMLKKTEAEIAASLARLKTEKEAEFGIHFLPFVSHFESVTREYKDKNTEDLVSICEDFLSDKKVDPFKFAIDAAKANMERQRKREAEGKYVRVDVGIYALSEA